MADLDPSLLSKLRVVDLREHLSSRGLPTSGLKAELVKRLRDALENEQGVSGNANNAEEPMSVDSDGQAANIPENETSDKPEETNSNSSEMANIEQLYREEEKLKMVEENRRAEEMRIEMERAVEKARLHKEEERLRLEQEKRAEKERLRLEEEKKAEQEAEKLRLERERLRLEQERKAAEERLRLEQERKAEEERFRLERERKAEEERFRLEQERKAEEERLCLERERRAAEERLRVERERRAEEERLRVEREKKAEEERLRLEQERKAEEERLRVEQERKAEEERLRAEQERKAEEEKLKAEQERRAEEERQWIERERKAIEEERRQRVAEEERIREEKRVAAEKERRMAEEAEMQKEQERWLVEEQMKRAQEEHKKRLQAQEKKRVLEEQQKLMEEELERQQNEQQMYHIHQENQNDFSNQSEINTNSLPPNSASFVPMSTAMNIMPPPPTVLMSNIPPPPPSMIPNPLSTAVPTIQVSAPPTRFPPPLPVNISAPPTPAQQFITQMGKETNSVAPVNEVPLENNVSEEMDTSENTTSTTEIKLPQALEKVLALKTERAQQLGIDPDAVVQPIPIVEDKITGSGKTRDVVTLVSVDEDEYAEEEEKNKKNTKSRRRKKKKKKHHNKVQQKNEINKHRSESLKSKETSVDIDIEYVQEVIDISDPMYTYFTKIFEKFKLTEGEKEKEENSADATKEQNKELLNPMAYRKKPVDLDDDDDEDQDDKKEEEKPKLSKRKLKKLSRMTVAELKQKVNRPELVEMHDVTAKDPVLLLHLKASRNTVPVPRHWCFKRKYLQGKRGIEKPAFELPDFIKRTGIMEMRQALQEKEDQKTMKAKMRERVRPKLGKIDIDYQKLHDAFFKWQTKPKMTIHGDLYYEGKEFETRLKEKKPGDLSDDLRTALGMPTGPNANKCPPPWLIAMQRYGPPPSYPNLKIPGLNAPIPDGCSFGYHAGGWGKPPVDETGRPLYGDVFGTQIADNQPNIQEEEIDHTLWGELESESSEEEEEDEEEEEEEEEEKQEDETGLVTPAEGLITPSGFSSIPAGMETPDMIELRKRKIEAEKEGGETPALYTILPEKKNERLGAAMMASTHTYDLAGAIPAGKTLKVPVGGTTSVPPQGIEVALDPSELEMDSAAMAARYEQTMREQQSQLEKEDLSDMVAEHAARQKNKRKKQQLDSAKPPKKYKEFKF